VATPGVTAAEAADGEPGPPDEPVDLERLEGVARAAGDVATGGEATGERPLVARTPAWTTRAARDRGRDRGWEWCDEAQAELIAAAPLVRGRCRDRRAAPGWGRTQHPGRGRPGRRRTWRPRRTDERGALSSGVGAGCARPPLPPCGGWRRPHAGAHRRGWGQQAGGSPIRDRDGRGDPDGGARRRCGGHGSARSGRQALPTLEAPRPQDVAAGAGRHAMPEAVALGAAAVVGLECALHGVPPRPSGLLVGPSVDLRRRRCGGAWGVATKRSARHRLAATVEGASLVRQHRPRATVRHPPADRCPCRDVDVRRRRFPHVWTPLWNEARRAGA
jgi:hypothetical protein